MNDSQKKAFEKRAAEVGWLQARHELLTAKPAAKPAKKGGKK